MSLDKLQNIVGSALECGDESFLSVMTRATEKNIAIDIAAASEMLGLLHYFLEKLKISKLSNSFLEIKPGIYYDDTKLSLMINIGANELDLVALWASQGLNSDKVAAMPGVLVIPFSIETKDGVSFLIPEWFVLFYVESNKDNCIPILAFNSILNDDRFADWVSVALSRAKEFMLPVLDAQVASEQVIVKKATYK